MAYRIGKSNELAWNRKCRLVEIKDPSIVNENLKIINDEEDLRYYCKHCKFKNQCYMLLDVEP